MRSRLRVPQVSLLFAFRASASREAPRPADLVVYGGVWTGDSTTPWAGGVAVAGDTVAAVGDSAAIAARVGPATRVLANGSARVTPGFMDSHVHFTDGGFELAGVDLRPANLPAEFIARLKAYATERTRIPPEAIKRVAGRGRWREGVSYLRRSTALLRQRPPGAACCSRHRRVFAD